MEHSTAPKLAARTAATKETSKAELWGLRKAGSTADSWGTNWLDIL
jgi:hypothetical protein